MSIRLDRRWLIVVLSLIIILIYLPLLRHQYVWDDFTILRDLSFYRETNHWIQALGQPTVFSSNHFRPLAILTFMVDLGLGEPNPVISHTINLLLHTINSILITLLAQHLMTYDEGEEELPWIPFLAGLLYGLHPALVEGVALVASRFELLMTTFLLLALVVDSRLTHNRARYIILPIAFLFACLSHEIALIFLIILPIWHLARRRMTLLPLADYLKYQKESGNLLIYGAVALTLCGYLAIRYASLGYLMTPIEVDLGNTLQRVLLFGRSLFEYILLTIFPFTRLSPYHYRTLPLSATDLAAWISLIMILMAGAGIVRMVRTRPRPGWLFFAGFITILSISNVIPMSLPGNAFVAERFLLFPIALFILAAVSLIRPLRERINGFSATETTTARSLVTIWFLASLVTIQLIIPNWTDNLSLWNWAVRGTRNSTYPHLNLAREYINQSRYELGLAAADYALEIDPSDGEAWNIAGVALISLRNFDEARVVLEKATELQPDNALYWNNLAAAHRELGEFERAEQLLLQESLSRDPNLAIGYINLTMVYLKAGRPDLASQVLKSIQETLPQIQSTEIENLVSQTEEPDRWLELGGTLLSLGEAESALQAFEQAETLGASKVDVVAGKAEALIRLERWSQVEALILTALEETPNDARFEYALGIVAQERGNMEDAQNHYQRAAILAPDWELPQQKLEELEVVNGGNQAP